MEQFTPENKELNVSRGLDLAKRIAGRHEKELREIIAGGKVESYTDHLVDGEFTTEGLIAEFEREAQKEGIDLESFYAEAPRMSVHGHQFEVLAIVQIILPRPKSSE